MTGTKKPKIALATHIGGDARARACDIALASALYVRGGDPEFLLCDGALPACEMTALAGIRPADLLAAGQLGLCSRCFTAGVTHLSPTKHPVRMMGDYLTPAIRATAKRLATETPADAIRSAAWERVAVGEHAYAGAARYLGREPGAEAEPVLRRFLEAATLSAAATAAVIDDRGVDILVAHGGALVPQGPAAETARRKGVRVVVYEPAMRAGSYIFSHGESVRGDLDGESAEAWLGLDLTARNRADLEAFLAANDTSGLLPAGDRDDAAKRRAYHLLFRRMIPLPFIRTDGQHPSIDAAAAADLRPGRWAGLDVICDGVLEGTPFVYPAEKMWAPFSEERAA